MKVILQFIYINNVDCVLCNAQCVCVCAVSADNNRMLKDELCGMDKLFMQCSAGKF